MAVVGVCWLQITKILQPIYVWHKSFLERPVLFIDKTCREMALYRFEQTPGLRGVAGGERVCYWVGQ
jgi:hypothetical protein